MLHNLQRYETSVCRLTALNTLYALFSNTKLVREAHEKAAVLFLLDVFCNCETPGFRERAAEVITKMVTDKLVGPKVSFPWNIVSVSSRPTSKGADLCNQVPPDHLCGCDEAEPRSGGGDA